MGINKNKIWPPAPGKSKAKQGKISTDSLLKKFNIMSVNHLNAQSKLLEVWKSLNVNNYPLTIPLQSNQHEGAIKRADNKERPKDIGRSTNTKKTCISDAISLWNSCTKEITTCKSLYKVKKEIKLYVQSLPI